MTRTSHPPEDLLRLVAGPDGAVEVDPWGRIPGRGAWILPQREVIADAEKRPGILQKALHAPGIRVDGLLERCRGANLRALLDMLSLAARAGLLASGAEQVASARSEAIGLIVANDAAPGSIDAARSAARELPVWVMPLDRVALGYRIGKGPRAVIALRPGAATRTLIRQLRRMEQLG